MKKQIKKAAALLLTAALVLGTTACGTKGQQAEGTDGTTVIKVAYQYGLAYAPLTVMQEQGLIEKNYDGDI